MKLTVITATYNALEHLPKLVESLRGQEDKEFEWVVVDGMSKDGTIAYLKTINDLNIKVSTQMDFGIYDALNRGIEISSGDFYLVIGADDVLYPNAIRNFKEAIDDTADIVTAFIELGDEVSKPKGSASWFYGQFTFVSGHSVGSIYRKSLHYKYGFYSKRFPIAADQHFILNVVRGGGE